MPTAAQYQAAAADFEDWSSRLGRECTGLACSLGPRVVLGRVRDALDDAVGTMVLDLERATDECTSQAAECRRRADACVAYTEAWDAHEASREAWLAADPADRPHVEVLPAPQREPWMDE